MKRTVKIVLPLVLIAVLLIGAGWFFLSFRRDVTATVFGYWGDRFAAAGRYERAISCYKAARTFEPDNERIPIILADTYVNAGNYTKAEYTLVSAITESPDSPALYIALSRAYVAQDKLLDAEQMLDRITSESVRETIDYLRPSAPVISPESGYYSEYIDVAAASAGSSIYLTTDGTFPSLEKDLYTQPVAISGGETTVTALCVGENGLVSPVVYAGYTIGNVVEPVKLADSVLEAYVREQLGKLSGEQLMTDELWTIESLELPEGITTLEDLPRFAGLKSLTMHDLNGLDLSVIGQLTTLNALDVAGCTLPSDTLELIGSLPDLTSLNISGCAVQSINALVGLTKLEYLNISNNTVSDITALSSMENLRELHLTNNPVRTITYLNNCLKLEVLYAENCGISKLTSLAGNTSLQELYASDNEIDDLSALEACAALRVIDVSSNQIDDISVLPSLPELTTFKADHNKIAAVPTFDAEVSKLVQFNVNYNEIESVQGLAGLMYLNYVRADYNKITSIACLKDCYTLIEIDVFDNPVNADEVAPLQEIGIIVNYNPKYEPEA